MVLDGANQTQLKTDDLSSSPQTFYQEVQIGPVPTTSYATNNFTVSVSCAPVVDSCTDSFSFSQTGNSPNVTVITLASCFSCVSHSSLCNLTQNYAVDPNPDTLTFTSDTPLTTVYIDRSQSVGTTNLSFSIRAQPATSPLFTFKKQVVLSPLDCLGSSPQILGPFASITATPVLVGVSPNVTTHNFSVTTSDTAVCPITYSLVYAINGSDYVAALGPVDATINPSSGMVTVSDNKVG